MTPEQEDALVEGAYEQAYRNDPSASIDTLVRLAIRAAYAQGVAQERERAAKVCEEHEPKDYTMAGIMTRMICAAAIRRGE